MEWDILLNNRYQISNLIKKLQIDEDEYILSVGGSYGDVFPTLALMPQFYIMNRKNINIIIDKKYELLAIRFKFSYTKYFIIDSELQFRQKLYMEDPCFILKPGKVFPTIPTLHPLIAEAVLTERFSDYEMKRLLLSLPKGAQMELPQLVNYEKRVQNIFDEVGCRKGKTVILSFFANSTPILPLEIQIKIAEIAQELNFDVVFNVAKSFVNSLELDYSGFKTISIPADIPIELVNYAGKIIGPGTGLTAILSTFRCQGSILLLVNKTNEFIHNNGLLIRNEATSIKTVLSEEVNCNSLTELNFKMDKISFLYEEIRIWLKLN